jgi:hypothetical protein
MRFLIAAALMLAAVDSGRADDQVPTKPQVQAPPLPQRLPPSPAPPHCPCEAAYAAFRQSDLAKALSLLYGPGVYRAAHRVRADFTIA